MLAKRLERKDIMLCTPATQVKVNKLGSTFIIQPKFRGERAWVRWTARGPKLISSGGIELKFIEHIEADVASLFITADRPPMALDGEIYVHGWSQERIHSAASRKVNRTDDCASLEFHVFDYKASIPQIHRMEQLMNVLYERKGSIIPVGWSPGTPDNWLKAVEIAMSQGYEGIVMRAADGLYVEKRNARILKFKPTEKDDYLIVGYEQGTGWAEGMLGSFLVQGDDGVTFSVGTGRLLTKDNRAKFWQWREDLIGRTLVVKHETLKTRGGTPVCSSAFELK